MTRLRKTPGRIGYGPVVVQIIGIALAVVGFIMALSSFNSGCGEETSATGTQDTARKTTAGTTTEAKTTAGGAAFTLETPEKTAHYVSNTPAHKTTLPAPPVNVVIDFDSGLTPPSHIAIIKDDKEYGTGDTKIDEGNLTMRRDMDQSAPAGLYDVYYKACWPDGSCPVGHFQFAVDPSLNLTYNDMRGLTDVEVSMTGISFQPQNIIISPGAKVTWTNNDSVEHFVNTDPHPVNTYYPPMNSPGLSQGDTFAVTFTMTGYYPYYCSAHPDQMRGSIIVKSVISGG